MRRSPGAGFKESVAKPREFFGLFRLFFGRPVFFVDRVPDMSFFYSPNFPRIAPGLLRTFLRNPVVWTRIRVSKKGFRTCRSLPYFRPRAREMDQSSIRVKSQCCERRSLKGIRLSGWPLILVFWRRCSGANGSTRPIRGASSKSRILEGPDHADESREPVRDSPEGRQSEDCVFRPVRAESQDP